MQKSVLPGQRPRSIGKPTDFGDAQLFPRWTPGKLDGNHRNVGRAKQESRSHFGSRWCEVVKMVALVSFLRISAMRKSVLTGQRGNSMEIRSISAMYEKCPHWTSAMLVLKSQNFRRGTKAFLLDIGDVRKYPLWTSGNLDGNPRNFGDALKCPHRTSATLDWKADGFRRCTKMSSLDTWKTQWKYEKCRPCQTGVL
jgi:hypothetical protein